MTDELVAKQAITEVLYRYCRGLDRMDRDTALAVWHPDGTANYGDYYEGTGAGFVDWAWKVHAGLDRHSHQISNILIHVDGDRAVSEAYVTVCLRTKPVDGQCIDIESRGRYADRWSRRNGRWAIDHRIYVDDMTHQFEVPPEQVSRATNGRRGPDDPSYDVIGR